MALALLASGAPAEHAVEPSAVEAGVALRKPVAEPSAEARALQAGPQDLTSALARIDELEKLLANQPSDSQAAQQVEELKEENAELAGAVMQAAKPFLNYSSTAAPMHAVGAFKMREILFEEAVLMLVFFAMVIMCLVPVMYPFRRFCETKKYRYYPFITVFNLIVLALTLKNLYMVSFNQVFFWIVLLIEFLLGKLEKVLIGVAALTALAVLWKFKDRLLEALGVEQGEQVIGDFRDWVTCWSMRRFHPVEVFIWKVEGLPAAWLHTPNDVFCEASIGYNVAIRTRVHLQAGHSCVLKESMQINFDPFDLKTKLTLTVKHQETIGSSELASLQLGASQINRFEEQMAAGWETQRGIGWAAGSVKSENFVWKDTNFRSFDLMPAGRIWLRFVRVPAEDEPSSFCGWCWPSSKEQAAEAGYGGLCRRI